MNNLKRLMTEFAILGMEAEPLDAENGLEFDPNAAPVVAAAPEGEEVEYELDADGNPILDSEGNPIPKLKPEQNASACTCDQNTLPAAEEPPAGGLPALPPPPPAAPEEEFDFDF